jgi:hypothetical protein
MLVQRPAFRIATGFLVLALVGMAATVGFVVVKSSHPAATHVVLDSSCAPKVFGRAPASSTTNASIATCEVLVKLDTAGHAQNWRPHNASEKVCEVPGPRRRMCHHWR